MKTETPDPSKVISPKVIAGTVAGLSVAVLGAGAAAVAGALNPGLFDGLGPWGVVAYSGSVAVLGQVAAYAAGYIKRDPLRQ
jgi:hypothetical protein